MSWIRGTVSTPRTPHHTSRCGNWICPKKKKKKKKINNNNNDDDDDDDDDDKYYYYYYCCYYYYTAGHWTVNRSTS